MNKKVNFCSEVRTAFAFLVQDKGFQVCRESSTDGLEYVEFRSDSTFVRVLCTGPDFEPRMVFGRNGCDGVKGSESFDWVDLKELDCCKLWTWSSSSDKPYDGRLFGEEKRCQEPFIDICVAVCYFGWLWEEQSERQLVV